VIHNDETSIMQINFYSGGERLVRVGFYDERAVVFQGNRIETCDIANDEQLVGCKIDYTKEKFCGLTWLKMKVPILEIRHKQVK
jgi:hypothetical protein